MIKCLNEKQHGMHFDVNYPFTVGKVFIVANYEMQRFISKANIYKTLFAQQTHVNKIQQITEQK